MRESGFSRLVLTWTASANVSTPRSMAARPSTPNLICLANPRTEVKFVRPVSEREAALEMEDDNMIEDGSAEALMNE